MVIPHRAAHASRRRAAFTLTELLMVLGIAVVVFALLAAAFTNSLQKARQIECLSNLHSLSLAVSLYVADADGYYPPVYNGTPDAHSPHRFPQPEKLWLGLLTPYLRADFPACAARSIEIPGPPRAVNEAELSGYFYNRNLGEVSVHKEEGHVVRHTAQDTQLSDPARTVLLAEGRLGLLAASHPDTDATVFRSETVSLFSIQQLLTLEAGGIRHNGGANYAFADGHLRWHAASRFERPTTTTPTFALGMSLR